MSAVLPRPLAIRVFVCLASAYLLSYAMRSVNAAIAPALVADFSLSNADLGSLSSAYFFAFALMQLPLGVWLDRFGSRRTHAILLVVAACGCLVFATASSTAMLWTGRALIGAGVAGGLMAALRVFRFWYAPDRQQQLVVWMLVVGSSGAMLASAPAHAALPVIGWRGLFTSFAGLFVFASAAIWWLLPKTESWSARPADGVTTATGAHAQGFAGYLVIYRDPYLWRFALIALIMQSGFIAFQTLWIGPWLTQALAFDPAESASIIFAFNLVFMTSLLTLGSAVRGLDQRGISVVGVCATTSLVIIVLHLGLSVTTSPWIGVALWLACAMATTPMNLIQSHVCLTFPEHLTGRAFTAYNLMIFSGVFLVQWLFGVLIDWCLTLRDTEGEAFRLAMQIWVVLEVIAVGWLLSFRASPFGQRTGSRLLK